MHQVDEQARGVRRTGTGCPQRAVGTAWVNQGVQGYFLGPPVGFRKPVRQQIAHQGLYVVSQDEQNGQEHNHNQDDHQEQFDYSLAGGTR